MNINTLCSHISNSTQKSLNLSQDDRDKLNYSLQVILGEISKLLILFALFLFTNAHAEFIMAFLALTFIRANTGGLHFKTYLGCLVISCAFFASAILLLRFTEFAYITMSAIGFTGLAIIALISPITSSQRPNYSNAQRMRFKIIGCIGACIHLIGFMATKNNPYFTISVWVIFLQAIQLLFAWGGLHYEKELPH